MAFAESRLLEIGRALVKMSKSHARLLISIHKLEKSTTHNLGQLAETIKDPEHFDIEDYRKQLAKAEFLFDQMDASLDEIDLSPDTPPGAPQGGA